MNKLKLTIAMPDYDHVADLALGRVEAQGIDITFLSFPVEEIFHRFLHGREWDVWELSLAKFVSLIAQGDDSIVGLPVFPSRVFRHSSLFVRSDGSIKTIADLKGRRVGVPEWAQTAAVYSRGYIRHQFGVDLASIDWVQAGVNDPGRAEKVELELPKGLKLTRIPGKSLNDMLLSGEIDAVLAARPPKAFLAGDKRIRRFFENYQEVETAYYQETRIFPIMHTLVMTRTVFERHPWAALNLFKALEESKRRAVERMFDTTVSKSPLPWGAEYAQRGLELLGEDYFPYGIEKNRHTLTAFLKLAHEQGVAKRLLTPEDLFPKTFHSQYKV